jgi:cob(I)alamin adenosyltransferase
MRIYTRTGDSGETGLFGGERVTKDDLRVETYGTVDEASAALGLAASSLAEGDALHTEILALQNELFVLGADLATPLPGAIERIEARHINALEARIDLWEATLAPLRQFILPGGTSSAAALHLARTVARRAERRTVALLHAEPTRTSALTAIYLNRLSDLLFVLARAANRHAGQSDTPWKKEEINEPT